MIEMTEPTPTTALELRADVVRAGNTMMIELVDGTLPPGDKLPALIEVLRFRAAKYAWAISELLRSMDGVDSGQAARLTAMVAAVWADGELIGDLLYEHGRALGVVDGDDGSVIPASAS